MGKDLESLIKYLEENLRPQEARMIIAKTGTKIKNKIYSDYDVLNCTKDCDGHIGIYSFSEDADFPRMKNDFLIFWITFPDLENLVLSSLT
jgi:hypothetical protein